MVGRLAIKTLCDSWLEHIYQKKIKFRFDLSQADNHIRPDKHNHSAASPEPNSSWQTSVFCASGWSPVNTSLRTPGGETGGGRGVEDLMLTVVAGRYLLLLDSIRQCEGVAKLLQNSSGKEVPVKPARGNNKVVPGGKNIIKYFGNVLIFEYFRNTWRGQFPSDPGAGGHTA